MSGSSEKAGTSATANQSSTSAEVLQLRILLQGFKPNIWRRIQVPKNFTFEKLHFTIQDAMGFKNKDFFSFKFNDAKNKTNYVEITEAALAPGNGWLIDCNPKRLHCFLANEKNIAEFFRVEGDSSMYQYGNFKLTVTLMKTLQAKTYVNYPIVVAGKRACPPEDCDDPEGYYEMVKILSDPEHDEYEKTMNWLKSQGYEDFNPEQFDATNVVFGYAERVKLLKPK